MNKFLIAIVSVIALVVIGVAIWLLTSTQKQSPVPPTNQPVTLPSSGSTTNIPVSEPVPSPGAPDTMTLDAFNGGVVVTRDFINNGVTIPDATNEGRYLLAGNLGYCLSDPQKCQAGPATDFTIFYDSKHRAFTIALLKEPIGQSRLAMEQFLVNTLGINRQDMCRLNYYVGTTYTVNTAYSSKNLGFSFCPGAVPLPTK